MQLNLSLNKLSRKLKYLVSLLAALILFFILYQSDKLLSVREITVNSTDKVIAIFGLEEYRDKNLVSLSTGDIEEKLKKQNPQIRNVEVTKKYPHTLAVRIDIYKPLAVIDNDSEFLYLSDDGRILNKSSQNQFSLPVINYYQRLNQYLFVVGDWISFKDIVYSLHFIKTLAGLGLNVERVDINGADMILCKIDNKEIIFTTNISQELQDYELEKIIRQFKIEGREFKSLDLRFEKPVVKF